MALGTKVDQKFAKASLNLNLSMAKCLISQGMLIPTSNIKLAEENLRVRALDLTWVNHLKMTMQFSPLATYTPWAVVTYTNSPYTTVLNHPDRFEFTVIGGNHSLCATQELAKEFPNNPVFQSRLCRVFYNPSEELALEVNFVFFLFFLLSQMNY